MADEEKEVVVTGAEIADTSVDIPSEETTFQFQDTATKAAPSFESVIPDSYKDKEFVQNILKSENPNKGEEFFKQWEAAQKLLGERSFKVPNEQSSPEEWKQFNALIGVPEDPSKYEFAPIAWDEPDKEAGAFIESQRDPKFLETMKAEMHRIGVPAKMAQQLVEAHDRAVLKTYRDEMQAAADTNRQLDTDFDAYMTRMHGPNKQMVFDSGRKLLHESVSPATMQFINELSESPEGTKALAVLADAMYGFHKKYVGEDTINSGSRTGSYGIGGGTVEAEIESISQKCRELMAKDEYRNTRHPENMRLRKEVDELYARQKELMAKSR